MKHTTTKLLSSVAAAALASGGASADTVLTTNDGIIRYNLCLGGDCADAEIFDDDTLRLKENNLAIHFDDTSNSIGYPNNDWRIAINSPDNGGDSYFAIDDATAGTRPFSVAAGAGNSALTVDSNGDVGIGTGVPVRDFNITRGDSPTLRLEQDGSGGWTPQTWDIGGSESSFFIRDVTHDSRQPFRIRPGSPTSALVIDTDGDIGVGTLTSYASVHVKRADGTAQLKIEETIASQTARPLMNLTNYGRPDIIMANTATGGEWAFGAGTNFVLKTGAIGSADGDKTRHLKLYGATGNLEITGEIITGGGTCGGGCDAVFTDEYDLPSVREHAEAMYSLGYLPNVGPTTENEPINVSDKLGRMLNELEHAHIYIAQQDERIADQDAQIANQDAQIAALTASVKALQESLADIEQ